MPVYIHINTYRRVQTLFFFFGSRHRGVMLSFLQDFLWLISIRVRITLYIQWLLYGKKILLFREVSDFFFYIPSQSCFFMEPATNFPTTETLQTNIPWKSIHLKRFHRCLPTSLQSVPRYSEQVAQSKPWLHTHHQASVTWLFRRLRHLGFLFLLIGEARFFIFP